MLLQTDEGIYLHTRSDGGLFNLARLNAKKKVRKSTIRVRDMLFAIVTHTKEDLQSLGDRFAKSCKEFGLTISINKTNVMVQGADPPDITINGNHLDIVDQFTYLGSTITNDFSLDADISKRIGKASKNKA